MSGALTEVTEIATALGTVAPTIEDVAGSRPRELVNVSDEVWRRLQDSSQDPARAAAFRAAFANGRAFLAASDGLRHRRPLRIEWKGPHRSPGDDVVPADIRIDHVFLVSCKYVSNVLLNPAPSRLFERGLVGDTRSGGNWFATVAGAEFEAFYRAAATYVGNAALPASVLATTKEQQLALRAALTTRELPRDLRQPWTDLCAAVATASAVRWRAALRTPRDRERLLRRMLRISSTPYFVLGSDRSSHLRLRVDSAWDWNQTYRLRRFGVAPRPAGQPEVAWTARVERRSDGELIDVHGHVEIRWSHGRFVGAPEAKVYLDTPHSRVPGYHPLV